MTVMKHIVYIPLYDIALLRLDICQNYKIISTSIVEDSITSLEQSNTSSSVDSDISNLVNKIRDVVYGRADIIEILPHLNIPDGLKGILLLSIMAIPRGKVASYSQIANLLRTSPRVVGRLLSMNPYPVLVPCHRVVRNSGEIGGYTPQKTHIKRKLLEAEGVYFDGMKIRRSEFVDYETLRDRFTQIFQRYREVRESRDKNLNLSA